MVNASKLLSGWCAVMLLAATVLTSAAWLRGPEYDEQYTLFLTAGTPRPDWPRTVFAAGLGRQLQSGQASLASIARDLRATDVHPPLYFWTAALWRRALGPGLFELRLLSVLCGLVSLAAVRVIARRSGIGAPASMLLTLGCYGFVYTNVIARGFAPAQVLILCGIAILTGRSRWQHRLAAGALFGAACCCNYLAVFVAAAVSVLVSCLRSSPHHAAEAGGQPATEDKEQVGGWLIFAAAAPFLALDAWFFAAQHASRTGQFPPFDLFSTLPRLMAYQVANVFGGLPLYVDDGARIIAASAIAALALGLLAAVIRARPLSGGSAIRVLLGAAIAPPAGLLLLGAVFNNAPIELRYLSFGVPFIALLAAWTCVGPGAAPGRRQGWTKPLLMVVALVQLGSILGLVSAPSSMQPARATAEAAARLAAADPTAACPATIRPGSARPVVAHPPDVRPAVGRPEVAPPKVGRPEVGRPGDDAVILLPRGNDGVGIVGAFALSAPPALRMLLVSPIDSPALLRARSATYRRVVLALIAQDRDSAASLPIMREAFDSAGWCRIATGFNVEAYERTIEGR